MARDGGGDFGGQVLLEPAEKTKRKPREPRHSWQLRTRPWQIQPFICAPVLPGETMVTAVMQARIVTKPIKNPLIGWWKEYYFFYVKHRDLDARDTLTTMMLNQEQDNSSMYAPGDQLYQYQKAGSMNWSTKCLKRVVEEYFRDEGEVWNTWAIDGVPIANINSDSWTDSLLLASAMPDVVDDDDMGAVELDAKMRTWEFMRANKMTSLSYEQWLGTYGVHTPKLELHRPELLRYVREYQYPSNTVDPTTGAPSSAVSWTMSERLDKNRFFTEPGFIFGVTVCRPKVYLGNQLEQASSVLNSAFTWLPAIMRHDPATSLKLIDDTAGPLQGKTGGVDYWMDVRDLFVYGDQFINFALTETDANFVALPTAALQRKYAQASDADAMFVGATSPANQIREDGVCQLRILGQEVDHT